MLIDAINNADVTQGLRRIAFGSVADAVKLMLRSDELTDRQLKKLDLYNVSGVKRSSGGITEIKFFDRIKALECLSRSTGGHSLQTDFIEALRLSAGTSGDDE